MASQQELEELVTRWTGDASQYIDMLSDAQAKTITTGASISNTAQQTTNKVEDALEKVGKQGDKVEVELKKVGRSLADIGEHAKKLGDAIGAITGDLTLTSVLEEFRNAEKETALLTAALEANGRKVRETIGDYQEFADKLEELTTTSGGEAFDLLRMAEAMDVTGDAAKRAVKNAIALSQAYGVNAQAVIKATTALEQGNTKALTRYIPTLNKLETETSKVAEAHRLLERMYGQVEAAGNTSAGVVKRLTEQWNKFKESIGAMVQQILNPFIAILQKLVSAFQALPEGVQQTIAVVMTLTVVLGTLATVVGAGLIAWSGLTTALGAYVTAATAATVASTILKVALLAGVAVAAYKAGEAIASADEEYEKFNNSLEESSKLAEQWSERFQSETNKVVESINRLADPLTKKNTLSEELQKARTELRGYQNLLSAGKNEVEELSTAWKRWTGNKVLQLAKTNVEEYTNKLGLAKSRVDQLTGALDKLNRPETDDKLTADINKFIDELKLQSETFGMTSTQVDIYKFSLRNASVEVLDLARRQADLNEQLKGFNDIVNKAKDATRQLQDEARTAGMDPIQARLTLLRDSLEKLNEQRAKPGLPADEFLKLGEAALKAQEAITQLEKAQEQLGKRKENLDLQKRGAEIRKQFRTAQEEYNLTIKELNELVGIGFINQEVYNRAVEAAKDKFEKATNASNKYKQSLQQLNAAAFGSAEAITRVQQFQESMRAQVIEARNRADLTINKEDEEAAKKLDETNTLLKEIRDKPSPMLGVVRVNP